MSLIEARKLTKVYSLGDVEVRALDGISTTIEKGEFVAIMGQSGSGKSTFMNVLGCLDTPTDGTLSARRHRYRRPFPGRACRDQEQKARLRVPGIQPACPEHRPLRMSSFPCSTTVFRPINGQERARQALKSVGLEGREGHHPNQLSGGQQQRVAIARALVNDAPIILADEPTGNLDTKTSVEIMELFVKLNQESSITVILVTHEQDIASFSKRIIRFSDGHIVSDEAVKRE